MGLIFFLSRSRQAVSRYKKLREHRNSRTTDFLHRRSWDNFCRLAMTKFQYSLEYRLPDAVEHLSIFSRSASRA